MNRMAQPVESDKPNHGEIAMIENSRLHVSIASLGARIKELLHEAVQGLAPEVERIIHADLQDEQEIEHVLDHLLDCACTPEGLALFKSLCRHYYTFNPGAAAEYVNSYRQMWEEEAQGDAT